MEPSLHAAEQAGKRPTAVGEEDAQCRMSIQDAAQQFAVADRELAATAAAVTDERVKAMAERLASLTQLAQVGSTLIEQILQGESVDSLPIKTVGELARSVTNPRRG